MIWIGSELRGFARPLSKLWARSRWWLVGIGALTSTLAVYGACRVDGFLENIYSEIVGSLFSVLIAIVLVEAILDRRDGERWAAVREQTTRTIETVAQQAAFDFHLALSVEARTGIPSPAVMPLGGHARILRRIALRLRAREYEPEPDPAVLQLQETISQPLYHLIDGLGPRIYASGDPELVRRFGVLVEESFAWDRSRYLYEATNPELLWANAAETADALADLVEHAQHLVAG